MNLKTYRAKTMADALAAVKRDLGHDAYILHTRTQRVGGLFGVLGRPVVEITASDAPPRRRKAKRPSHRPAQARPSAAAAARAYASAAGLGPRRDSALPPANAHVAPPPADHARRPTEPKPEITRPPERFKSSHAPEPDIMTVCRTGLVDMDRARPSVEDEIASVKRMLARVLHNSNLSAIAQQGAQDVVQPIGRLTDSLSDHYLRLLESAVASEIADEVIGAVRDELTPQELADGQIVRQTVLRHLADMVPTATAVPRAGRCEDGRPMTIALVGPTGVGKTTTVAKLAASYKLRHGRRIGLITTDTYRIAAVDQLRMYADIIGVPLKVALTSDDMASAVESFRDRDVILIDTAGRSQRDRPRISELSRLIDAARPHETHLVLAGNGNEEVLIEAAQNFGAASPNRVIFTKLDEAVNFGVLLNVARRVSLQLSYVTTGQEVPDHIEVGRSDRIARLILDNASPLATATAG